MKRGVAIATRTLGTLALATLALGTLVLGACARSGERTPVVSSASADSAMRSAAADSSNWPSYGRDYTNQRYSKLAQITAANVGQLQLAWHYANGITSGYETSPIVIDGTMYITTPLNHVVALDAATGAKKWEYVHQYRTTVDCCGPINRGVAVYGGRVFMGTVDARLVALDAKTGHVEWETVVGDNEQGYHITGAPIAIDGKVITGISCGEQGGRCYVSAYDAATGALVWRWNTIPSPAEGGWWGSWKTTDAFGTPLPRDIAAEKRDSAKYADAWQHGGGPMWMTAAADASLGLLFMGIGNPAPDVDGRVRPGDNLYTDCLVALDIKTGKLRWYFQQTPHDLWDYDPSAPVVLLEARDAGGNVVPARPRGSMSWTAERGSRFAAVTRSHRRRRCSRCRMKRA
jgi:alcohol dehydrogenase (cytochrome c)